MATKFAIGSGHGGEAVALADALAELLALAVGVGEGDEVGVGEALPLEIGMPAIAPARTGKTASAERFTPPPTMLFARGVMRPNEQFRVTDTRSPSS